MKTSWVSLASSFIALQSPRTISATCNSEQYQALSAFYWDTNGPSWRTKTNWMSDTDCSSDWFQLTTDDDGNVAALTLGVKGVAAAAGGGTLPSELGLLSAMTLFNFRRSAVNGPIPCWLGLMTSVEDLNLDRNSLTGRIPSWLGLMTKVSTANGFFRLRTNQLCGTVPVEVRLMSGGWRYRIEDGNDDLGTVCPGAVPSPQPTLYPTPTPTRPSPAPTSTPTIEPSQEPTPEPTFEPTPMPTYPPSPAPTREPSPLPTAEPSHPPTPQPTWRPTYLPTARPTPGPTSTPFPTTGTGTPSTLPTPKPSVAPTSSPTPLPTLSLLPSPLPTAQPTHVPSPVPTTACGNGTFLNLETHECEICGIGRFSITYQKRDGREEAPQVRNCTLCPAGRYNIETGSKSCLACDEGKLAAENRASCQDCNAGQYNYRNLYCRDCESGKYAPSAQGTDGCLSCYAGDFTNNQTGATTCSSCDAGLYSGNGAYECLDCPVGKFSLSRAANCTVCPVGKYTDEVASTSCTSCAAGYYQSEEGLTSCDQCPTGQNQPSTGSKLCLDCAAGKYAASAASLGCDTCDIGFDSDEGRSSCKLAAVTYYITEFSPSVEVASCPDNADCAGAEQAPAPRAGYWVDRSSYDYADVIYACFRETCIGGDKDGPCWNYTAFGSSEDDDGECPASEILCMEGAYAPLCGSCKQGYIYSASSKECRVCGDAQQSTMYILGGIAAFAALVAVLVLLAFLNDSMEESRRLTLLVWVMWILRDNPLMKMGESLASNFDEGSLKVFWATEQIIMSCSWNLDVAYPPPFSKLLASLSVFSLDFLALECFQDVQDRYFTTSYMWSLFPILAFIVIFVVYMFRITSATISASLRLSKAKNSFGESPYLLHIEVVRRKIKAQHVMAALLLSYLVLPPVAMKHFQALDCVPFGHDGSSYLRVDTAINCHSTDYIQFRYAILLFLVLYQSIPVLWFVMLFRVRERLNPRDSDDPNLALFIRDQDTELDSLRFLFHDYKAEMWWFEVFEMYRRTMYVGVLPLASPEASVRASLGVVLSIFSVAYYREREPFRIPFTNLIATVAQYMILLVFYAALSLSTGQVVDFGLGDGIGLGIFLCVVNLLVLGMVIHLGWTRFKAERQVKLEVYKDANQDLENATEFTKGDFADVYKEVMASSVSSNHVLAFHYTTEKKAKRARRSGIVTSSALGGIPISLRGPHQVTRAEASVFKEALAPDEAMFNAVLAIVVPSRMLIPIPGVYDPHLRLLPTEILLAFWPATFTHVLYPKPWLKLQEQNTASAMNKSGTAILPPANIVRSFLLCQVDEEQVVDESELKPRKNKNKQTTTRSLSRRITRKVSDVFLLAEVDSDSDNDEGGAFEGSFASGDVESVNEERRASINLLLMTNVLKTRLMKLQSVLEFLKAMKQIRAICSGNGLVPVYHYTSPEVVPYVFESGLRMSVKGPGGGGVYVSTRGPASYGLGTRHYEDNLIKDCFGLKRLFELRGKGKLDAVVVYGCSPMTLGQVPGGRDRCKAISKQDFLDMSLPNENGNFFLRPDRILGVYHLDPWDQPPVGRKMKDKIMAAAFLQIEKDNDVASALKITEVARIQEDNVMDIQDMVDELSEFRDVRTDALSISDEAYAPLAGQRALEALSSEELLRMRKKKATLTQVNECASRERMPSKETVANSPSSGADGVGAAAGDKSAPTEKRLTMRERMALAKLAEEQKGGEPLTSGDHLTATVDGDSSGKAPPPAAAAPSRPPLAPAAPPIRADKYCQLSIFTPAEYARVMVALLDAVADLHKNGLVHGDIKPANIFIHGKRGKVALSPPEDADLAAACPHKAPEFLKVNSGFVETTKSSTAQGDMYSCAIALWELWFKLPPFNNELDAKVVKHLHKGKRLPLTIPGVDGTLLPPSLEELITSLWVHDPYKRVTVTQAQVKARNEVFPELMHGRGVNL